MLLNRNKFVTCFLFAYKTAFLWGLVSFSSYIQAACVDVYAVEYGPFDYESRADREKMLKTVERRHFTKKVESLAGGETGSIMGDLSYTLEKFPNHYPALMTLVRYSDYEDVKADPYVQDKINCFFIRAQQFKPSNYRVYQIYGIYLFGKGDYKSAIESYAKSLSLRDSAEVHYNIGLAYLKSGDVKNAEFHARKAYSKGYPLPGLKNMLMERQVSIE